jgi:hypothetical protein
MSHNASSQSKALRLVGQALEIFATHIGEDANDTETVMAEFLAGMMTIADKRGADFDAILEAARAQSAGGF